LPEGLSVHDTLRTDHFTHGILPASGHMDISDSKHLLTGNQAALLKADMVEAATEWLNHIISPMT
jgi:prolyl-tRNA editing enzyme YbaK/EbsC (Cys-tRNA(Pro) deacylase)